MIPELTLIAGKEYTVKRIQRNWTDSKNGIESTQSKMLIPNRGGKINFPINYGDISIIGSKISDGIPAEIDDECIPYIDLVMHS